MLHSVQKILRPLLALAVLGTGLMSSPLPAISTDLAPETTMDAQVPSRVLRLALDKSIVIRLPAAAKDILVGNPAIVDAVVRTHSTAYLFARAPGQTNIFFFDANGKQILDLDLEVTRDPSGLQRLLERSLPDTQITVDTMGETVILGGIAANAEEAGKAMELAAQVTGDPKKVVSTVAITGKEQVMLKVRIVEMQRSLMKQLRINTAASIDTGSLTTQVLNVNPFASALATQSFARLDYAKGSDEISASIQALESEGLLRTLAEPTLTAISGESANFLAGGEFPIPTNSKDGVITVTFKSFGVGLGFTPVVLDEGRISMKINTEVSELSNDGGVTIEGMKINGIKTRKAATAVEMPSGGSMVMAGLISDSQVQGISGTSGLKDIPVLGALFRSREYQAKQTELVVIVTPYVVDSVAPGDLSTPIDSFNAPSDSEAFIFGTLNRVYGPGAVKPSSRWRGQVGFIVE
jgi:pilus assembly protein CpaC